MTEKSITVSEAPLREVLQCFQGADHYLLELKHTRGLPLLNGTAQNPVERLCVEVNAGGVLLAQGDEQRHVICLCPDCTKPRDGTSYHLNNSNSVAVANNIYYFPMLTCPRNVKVLLLGPGHVATLGVFNGDPQWLGWFPLPKERK